MTCSLSYLCQGSEKFVQFMFMFRALQSPSKINLMTQQWKEKNQDGDDVTQMQKI